MIYTQTIQSYIPEPLVAPEAIHPLDARAIAETLEEMTQEDDDCANCESLETEISDLEETISTLRQDLRELTNAVMVFLHGNSRDPSTAALRAAVKQFGSEEL